MSNNNETIFISEKLIAGFQALQKPRRILREGSHRAFVELHPRRQATQTPSSATSRIAVRIRLGANAVAERNYLP
ncbi:MAG TPA: hypothetical protein VGT24_12295 [Candidatus Acidoferrales bacterium]|nr:hypothetical protein [Candidatus Acidoferrales bacterium]